MVTPRAYPPYVGGIESYVSDISDRFAKKGFEIEICATDPSGTLEPTTEVNGIKIRWFRSFAPNGIYFYSMALQKFLRKAQADIIHCHGYRTFPALAAALAKKQNKIPLVITLHCGFSKVGKYPNLLYDYLLGRSIFKRADRIVIVSPAELQIIHGLGEVQEKITLLPNFVNTKEIMLYSESSHSQKRNDDLTRLLYVGRLEKQKGIHLLIKALKNVLTANKNVRFSIVGDGPFKPDLLSLIRKMELQEVVSLKGRLTQSQLYELYARSHIFVLLSEYESHSIALTEAMAFGLVPIATNVGGNRYLIISGKNGFLIQYPPKTEQLTSLLLQLINNWDRMYEMSKEAVLSAHKLDIERTIDRLENIYCTLGD
jgi:glycosyltransferase involved in cell wall biosynthesis